MIMGVEIKEDGHGNQVLWSEIGGKPVPLPVNDIFIRADGQVFTWALYGKNQPQRLRPHETAMVQFWLDERAAEIKPNVFAGEPPDG
jgi:hypothetical protein